MVEYVLFAGCFVMVAITAVGGLNQAARTYFQQSSAKIGQPVNQITYGPDGSRQTQASTTTITAPPPSTTTTAAPTTTRATTTTVAPTTTRATTTTAAPTTTRATTTTVAPTTTRATTTTVVSNPAFVTTVSNTSATSQWWNGSANNGYGAWVANATFTNAYNRGQTLDLLVTRTMSDGSTTTSTTTLYVGANGSATFSLYDNTLSKSSGVRTGVVSVTIAVTKVTTADVNWNTITSPGYGTTTTINSI